MPRRLFAVAGFCYLLFVVYGSLVPLAFEPVPLDVAWQRFLRIPWLALGPESRADWIANGVLYVPLGFLFTAALGGVGSRSGGANLLAGALVFVMAAIVAVVVEFAQQFFPPRTVSLNDLIAELIGTAGGALAWSLAGARLTGIVRAVTLGGRAAIRAAIAGYVLAYLAMSFFPYDFVLSASELQQHLSSGLHHPLLAGGACGGFLMCSARLAAETAAAVPLGLLMGMILSRRASGLYLKALVTGLAIGALIEGGQLFLLSGVSQGVSVLTRGLGLVLGVALQHHVHPGALRWLRPWLRPAVVLAAVPYAGLLLALNGWFAARWLDLGAAMGKLADARFLPFYYHYWTSEAEALRSLVVTAGSYLPVGVGYWMWRNGTTLAGRSNPWLPAALAAGAAFIIEAGKLFAPDKKPDPTNVLIAACAAYLACAVVSAIQRWRTEDKAEPRTVPRAPAREEGGKTSTAPGIAARILSVLLLVLVAWFLLLYPYGAPAAVFLAGYAAAIWRWPQAALPAILALLPTLDLAPWSGWFFFGEFDAVLLVSVAVLLWRLPAGNWSLRGAGVPAWLYWLLIASYAVSAAIGLLPLQPLDANAFSSYLSHYNSLRTLKGFVWALVLAPLAIHQLKQGRAGATALAAGMLAGLTGVALAAVWERHLFTGVFDFSSDFRIAATFSGLHTGGAYVEAYLVMAIPFLAVWVHLQRGAAARVFAAVLFLAASYALIVTFARAGFMAYAAGLVIVAAGAVIRAARNRNLPTRILAALVLLLAVGAAITVPMVAGTVMKNRWALLESDATVRSNHWSEVLAVMDGGLSARVFGMGLGSFPESYFLHHSGRVATYRYAAEAGNTWLVLGAGGPLWFGQRLPVVAGNVYTLQLDLRSAAKGAELGIALCEKSILYSQNCQGYAVRPKAAGNQWERHLLTLKAGELGRAEWYLRRPVDLSLANRVAGTLVDVDNVRVLDPAGRDIARNGDFSRGRDHWFFSSDSHLPWHAHSLALQVLFEQGGFGLLAFVMASLYALARLGRGIAGGDTLSAVLMAGMAGFLVVGLFDSLFDAPRLTLLFFLALFVGAAGPIAPVERPPGAQIRRSGLTR